MTDKTASVVPITPENLVLLRQQHDYLQAIIDGLPDAVMVIGPEHQVELMNSRARANMRRELLVDPERPRCYEVSHHCTAPCEGADHRCPLTEVLATGTPQTAIHNHPDHEGNLLVVEVIASPLFADDGSVRAVIETVRDITDHLNTKAELLEKEQRLDHLAHHDPLTGLPNRLLFIDRLAQAVAKSSRSEQAVAMLFVDIDRFKQVNDSLGHGAGDELLRAMSERMRDAVRAEDTVARLGGDEFAIMLEAIHKPQYAAMVAQKLLGMLAEPLQIAGQELFVTASIGISLHPQDGHDADTLLRNADAAMYQAKDAGRNTLRFYTEDMTEQAFQRVLMENQLRRGLEDNQLRAYYQPQIDMRNGELLGMEALVRWQHPEMGLVSPANFIPLAEDTGLVVPMGAWMIREACQQIVSWQQQGLNPGKVAVNLSGKQLQRSDLVSTVQRILRDTGCDPCHLSLEVTEGFIMDEPKQSIGTLVRLRDLGIDLAIDDFGTGYSSLAYLKKLPVQKLKIDGSFVRDIPQDANDEAIARAIIALAGSLGLEVIAEGVETEEQKAFLIREGCPHAQGFYYSRPIPADEMTRMLADWPF